MMKMSEDTTITESWKDKIYEVKLTELMVNTGKYLTMFNTLPTYENLRQSFLILKSFVYTVIYSNYYLKQFNEKVKPVMDDLEIILFGDPETKTVNEKCMDHKVELEVLKRGKMKKIIIHNGEVLIKEMWEIYFLVKQWCYDMGLFLTKPYEKRYGIDAIEEAMEI